MSLKINEIQEGSFKNLWEISCSLMISFFSMVAMLFCDRLFLANYSLSTLSAATSAGTLCWAGNFMMVTVCSIAEVFVAQYNGIRKYKKISEPVWQMVWLSLFSYPFFFCLAIAGSHFFYERGFFNIHEAIYYKWNNFFAPNFSLLAAISAFFLGQNKTKIVKLMAVFGNLINIILDPILIFGIKGWVPSMGIKGAAIATGAGIIVQVIVLGILFLNKNNHKVFHTNNWNFNFKVFWKCLRIGFPPAIFLMFELIGWSLFYKMMDYISPKYMLVTSMSQSILMLLIFFGLALEKGASIISGNLIGAKKTQEINRVFKSGLILSLVFTILSAVILIGFPDYLIQCFFYNFVNLEQDVIFSSPESIIHLKSTIKFTLAILVIYLALENIRFLISGMLTAAGDTLFLMIVGICSIWLLMLLPTYLLILKLNKPVDLVVYIWVFYSLITVSIFYLRFINGKWLKKNLI